MKKEYILPELEIRFLAVEDIVKTSYGNDSDDDWGYDIWE